MNNLTLLIISQVYVPDPASVGQHVADAAAAMRARGYRVRVLSSARGYDDPTRRYKAREILDGVEVRRLPLSSFGKSSIPVRLIGGGLFLTQCIVRGLFMRRLAGIMVSTSPPMCPLAALVIGTLRRVPIVYWMMDLNPDQMIALGKIKRNSIPARLFDAMNRAILRRARAVVALDRFMAERLKGKLDVSGKLHVMPPWPHEDHLDVVPHDQNPFRTRHRLDDKFVVMYSGNHGPSNPITTALRGAERMRDRGDIRFLFIGGGIGKKEVEEAIGAGAPNVVSMPYQPLSEIKYSLSAADLHLVTVGDGIVGIVHPCKVYGAMAVARPVLLLGPRPSHVADLLDRHGFGWQVNHGDVEGFVRAVEQAASDQARGASMGRCAKAAIDGDLSKRALCGRFCDVLEDAVLGGRALGADPGAGSSRAGETAPGR